MTKGIEFRFNAPFQSIEKQADGSLLVHLDNCDPTPADAVLVATGRTPNTKGLGLEGIGVDLDSGGAVQVAQTNHSSTASTYAVGLVTNRVPLTLAAIREGQPFAVTVSGAKPTGLANSYNHPA